MRTGCLIKILPKNLLFRFVVNLTSLVFITISFPNISHAENHLAQEKASTYLRWNLFTGRDQLQFSKKGAIVSIKTLNDDLYKAIKEEVNNLKIEDSYIKKISFGENDQANRAQSIDIELKNDSVEMFSFYREREKKYVVDFWIDGDTVTLGKAALQRPTDAAPVEKMADEESVTKIKPVLPVKVKKQKITIKTKEIIQEEKIIEKVNEDKILSSMIVDPTKKNGKSQIELQTEDAESKKAYRDFRYGATYVWDYDPIAPSYRSTINLKTKIPEFFYPIANRSFKKNDKEAHLQLTINLYRKKKWGLMYKSIKLFQQKYGATAEWELVEYLKINSILRENIDTPQPELFKSAFSMLNNLVEKTDNYELKKAINKYLLSYYMGKNEHLKILQISKGYFASTRDNFDFEESAIPAEAMLNSLAKLGQVEKIQELSEEKTIKKILPLDTLLAYQSYGLLRAGNLEALVKLYEKHKVSLVRSPNPVILYNTSEAYFRTGQYQIAMKLYQDFVKDFSHEFVASNATLRIALCSDLLDKNYDDTADLYKKAIDQSVDGNVSFEARIRYVAMRSIRKRVIDEKDREIRIFLDQDKNSNSSGPDKNLLRLLQQVRLRTLIVDGKFKEALAYLSLIPMTTMSKIDGRVYEGDGAEIIYGLIADSFKKSEYSQVIKIWQIYKDKYLDKVALDPYVNFIVGSSYVKIGLYKGFDDIYAAFLKLKDSPSHTFPIWVEREGVLKSAELLSELVIVKDIKLKNWDLVHKNLASFAKSLPKYNRVNYYAGITAFNEKEYAKAISDFENFFSHETSRVIYDPSDVADMIRAYTDSIYELGQTDKFLKVSEAILNDTNSFGTGSAYIQNVRERIAYLGIEISVSSAKKISFMELEKKITEFKTRNPKSIYTGRVNYLWGQSLITNQKTKEGKEVFTNLMNDKDVSDYIKELAKSELSLLNIREKTL
jgi:TolA-binding protein